MTGPTSDKPHKLNLTEGQFQSLVFALGISYGAASKTNQPELAKAFYGLADELICQVKGKNAQDYIDLYTSASGDIQSN